MPTAVVIGANRGIGLEFTKKLLAQGYQVTATCRDQANATDLNQLVATNSGLTIQTLDLPNSQQIQALKDSLNGHPVDLLVINAGVGGERGVTIGNVKLDNLQQVFAVNSFAPLLIADQLCDLVAQSEQKMVIVLTSRMGSIADNTSGRSYAYRGSKAALNAMMYSFAFDAKELGIKVLIFHPGWVRTSMGGENALIDTDESVSGMLNIVTHAADYPTGSFVNYRGEILPW